MIQELTMYDNVNEMIDQSKLLRENCDVNITHFILLNILNKDYTCM